MSANKWGVRIGVVAAALVLTPGTVGAAVSKPDPAVARTAQGLIRGTVAQDHRSFAGIPFAAAPQGRLRWQAPQPAAAWTGVRDATRPSPGCAQPDGLPMDRPSNAEDCLYLNVTTPVTRTARRALPVIVWLHGGHFFLGQGDTWGGQKMAVQGGAVVVTLNYRIGPLGFLTHPSIAGGRAGNLGLQDQQAALRWVRTNVAAFGGDPHNVTLAGQSAGATSVCAHLAAPHSAGLFHRAILQSNSCSVPLPTRAEATAAAEALIGSAECDEDPAGVSACMRRLPAEQLVAKAGYPGQTAWAAGPVAGDAVLPVDPARAVATGRFHRVPVMIGITRDEYRAQVWGLERTHVFCTPERAKPCGLTALQYDEQVRGTFGAQAGKVLERYPLARYDTPAEALSAIMTDAEYARPVHDSANTFSRHVPTYMYEFADTGAPFFTGTAPVTFATGAFHTAELPYLFTVGYARPLSTEQARLSRTMVAYWTGFAAQGIPHADGLPWWPRFHGASGHVQRLAPGPGGIGRADFVRDHQLLFWR